MKPKITSKALIKSFTDENFKITSQAHKMLKDANIPKFKLKKLINQMKQRRLVLAGGDVLMFLAREQIPCSMIISNDIRGNKK